MSKDTILQAALMFSTFTHAKKCHKMDLRTNFMSGGTKISIYALCFICVCIQAIKGNDITVKSYKVESRITSRFAHTTVKSSVVNSGPKAQSIGFNVQIPKRAFINNFTM